MVNIFFDIYLQVILWIKILILAAVLCFSSVSVAQTNGVDNAVLTEKIKDNAGDGNLEHWEKLANAGDREAQFRLALYYDLSSQVIVRDIRKSIYWYELAAKQGHTLAQYNLGVKYIQGEGIPKNINKAMSLWLLSANAGHMQSQFNVGRAYFLGVGLEEDQRKATFWFQKAAAQGDPKSIELLKKIEVPIAEVAEPSAAEVTQFKNNNDSSEVQPSISQAQVAQSQTLELQSFSNTVTNKGTDVVEDKYPKNINKPIDVYSGPYKHNRFIMQLPSRSGMSIVEKRGKDWFKVALEFPIPVWVDEKYFVQSDGQNEEGIIQAKGVYARAVPRTTKGVILGYFVKGEKVMLLEQSGNWHKVYPETRFPVWLKRQDWLDE